MYNNKQFESISKYNQQEGVKYILHKINMI